MQGDWVSDSYRRYLEFEVNQRASVSLQIRYAILKNVKKMHYVLKILGTVLVVGDSMLKEVDVSSSADVVSVLGLRLSSLCTAICERQIRPEGYAKIVFAVGTNDVYFYRHHTQSYYLEVCAAVHLFKFFNDSCRICIMGVLPRLRDLDKTAPWVEAANKAALQAAKQSGCAYYPTQNHFCENEILRISLFKRGERIHLSPPGVHEYEKILEYVINKL